MFQFHGLVDEIVPYDQAAALRPTWCNLGASVTWLPLPAEHVTGLFGGSSFGPSWMADRFAGYPVIDNCLLP